MRTVVHSYTVVAPSADLQLDIADTPDPVPEEAVLTLDFTASNNGPTAATGVSLTATLPASASFMSLISTQGICTETSGTVACDLGNLAASASATVTVEVLPSAAGTITTDGSVDADQGDPNLTNNADSEETVVTASTLCNGLPATIIGTSGDDVLTGTSGPDVIVGLGGNDIIDGLGGADTICGRSGDDTLIGGSGTDVLRGGTGTDLVIGGAGDDWLHCGADIDTLIGKTGNDVLYGGADSDNLDGGAGVDELRGNSGNDVLTGGGGNDTILGGGGDDSLFGEGGTNNTLNGGANTDSCDVGAGGTAVNCE